MNTTDNDRSEYTVNEIRVLINNMSKIYDVARLVDPIEGRILDFKDDGSISTDKPCYGIWNSKEKCVNCSSSTACKTGCPQEKSEHFNDDLYHIHSNPVRLKLSEGEFYDAVMELVRIKKKEQNTGKINDRALENTNDNAARYKATHDELTNILNTGSFYELSRNMISNNPDSDWIMITGNIMNFRLVNTLFGIQKGNEVLIKTADVLKNIAEISKGLCGRLGSDQFALLLPKNMYEEALLIKAEQDLASAFDAGIYKFIIHFGVYKISNPNLPIAVMCGRANSALHTIRDSLKETVAYFDDEMLKKALFEQEVIINFRKALKNNEFQMYLQPLVMENGKPIGAEALIRWIKPNGDMIMPGQFIEILERADMVHELDMYIWECAVQRLSLWKNTNKQDLTISVNMSAKDFFSLDIYSVITDLIEKYKVNASDLRLEITETALLEEPENSNQVVTRLREKGFIVELDDFGKGYSSLNMLKDISADILKIDMSLLQEIETKKRSKTILRSIIGMADALEMDVIAEGVENKEKLNILTDMGCRHFQGYYFSRPLPVSDFEKIFDEYGSFISHTDNDR
ncbi:MAG: GGDEF domain-containing phosphodiesterase [Lachnospiraceae bacterium]|nr:GGDEF domain-containing phosphodiesterase [Lachnospiraceae bacterium]